MLMRIAVLLLLLCTGSFSIAQESSVIHPDLLKKGWSASWISHPGAVQRDYGVYHFRKKLNVKDKPNRFIVHVSADNRYRLFVNGHVVCSGPARGDLHNWYFETVDLAPHLQAGENIIAAMVWNMGVHAPVAQISHQTAFVLQGNTDAEKEVNTNASWKVMRNESYTPTSLDNGAKTRSYMVIGPGDWVDASRYPWGWEQLNYADAAWSTPIRIAQPIATGYGTDNMWTLKPRNIPLMFERPQAIQKIRRVSGLADAPPQLSAALTVPAHSKVSILLDQEFNTVAYPELTVSGGTSATIQLTYAEALFNKNFEKGNRNEIEGKEIIGNHDVFIADGGVKRVFRPLWFRTYRYVQLDIETGSEPLVVHSLSGMATGYPFEVKASFASSDPSLQEIWDVGWRTAQLCAGETYFDCPYYEQLQYEGDTRIQSLISLYVTGDDRLMRKAILDFFQSRDSEGLTQGRYPSNRFQVIPPFSLYWISMLHDYWMHRKDDAFISEMLVGVMGVLDWYERRIDPAKEMLGPMKWWNFVDWNLKFKSGTPDGATDGNSSVISFQYAYTLRQAAELFDYFGKTNESQHYRALANKVGSKAFQLCYDANKGVVANTPEKISYSQHASIMAVLSDGAPLAEQRSIMERVLVDTGLSQATFYYRFYLNRALKKVGLADRYYSELKPWRDMLNIGLTTFAEEPEPTRSDCHAWSSSPNYDFFAIICGITPMRSAFSSVRVEPALGELQSATGYIPHPNGFIRVELQRQGTHGIFARIALPAHTDGEFVWKGKKQALKSGVQEIRL